MPRQRRVTDCFRLKGYRIPNEDLPVRPLMTDWAAAIPIDCGFTHCIEDATADRRQFGHLDHGAGVAFIRKIDKRSARCFTPLPYCPTLLNRPIDELVIVLGPARLVLQTLVTGGKKVAIHA
jgi:hypothetical protein